MDFIKIITKYAKQIYAQGAGPDLQRAFLDSLTEGQLYSKLAVVEMLKKTDLKFQSALFVGQWHGLLPLMLHQSGLVESGIGIEISPVWTDISREINSEWNWKSIQGNISEQNVWKNYAPDLVVNTSSEHMTNDWMDYVSEGTFMILQSTDYQISEHCNTVESLDQLIERAKLTEVIGRQEQDFKIYRRFTIFGKK